MYHSLIINVGDNYIDTWDDWKLIPSSRPAIAPPIERTKFVTVPGRDGALDYSRTPANRPTYDDRTGKIEFYLENDYAGWDWETAYTTICETLKGQRVRWRTIPAIIIRVSCGWTSSKATRGTRRSRWSTTCTRPCTP